MDLNDSYQLQFSFCLLSLMHNCEYFRNFWKNIWKIWMFTFNIYYENILEFPSAYNDILLFSHLGHCCQ